MAGQYPRAREGLSGGVDGTLMRLFFPVMVLGALLMGTLSGLGSMDTPSPLDRQLIAAAEQGDSDSVRRADLAASSACAAPAMSPERISVSTRAMWAAP